MQFGKRYMRLRNILALAAFGISAASLVLPYKHVLSVTNTPIRIFNGYELLFPFPALFFMLVTVVLLIVLRRKWSPLLVLIPSFLNVAALYFIRWEVHINIKGFVNTSSGIGFYLFTASTLLLFVICCANVVSIFIHFPLTKDHPELLDQNNH